MVASRRNFLRGLGIGAGAALVHGPAHAGRLLAPPKPDGYGVLVDLSLCEGCHSCEEACNEANKLAKPKKPFDADPVAGSPRRPDQSSFVALQTFKHPKKAKEQLHIRRQCMHCKEPACASACPVGAFSQTPEGAVAYNESLCMGCRYCMVACPFGMPSYSFASALEPRISKCVLCLDRIRKGKPPACVEACPSEASIFGKRADLLRMARKRIANDSAYVDHIYGEHEVGGTAWMYVSKVPFSAFGLPMDLETRPYIELTKGALGAVPLVLILGPALLTGLHTLRRGHEGPGEGNDGAP